VPGLGTSLGFGAATNHPRDLVNSDCILIMGSNMAESHPVGFHWPVAAKHRGAVLIHVDPRFTRTSAVADLFVKIRSGTDIAFLGGIIRYILESGQYFKEYVQHYTNAATIISGEYQAPASDGLFAGFNPETGQYDLLPGAWDYVFEPGPGGTRGAPRVDHTWQDPQCVFQILKRHYAHYTPEAVSRVCGCRPQELLQVAELLCRNSGRERTTSIAYSLGWTQHSTGPQMIRASAIIQLLLGNIGRPGGGIQALRGHACIQGSTDIPVLFDMLPGYLPQPHTFAGHATLADYLANGKGYPFHRGTSTDGMWHDDVVRGAWADLPKFTVSLLKAWYGAAATPENEFGYQWLPRVDDNSSEMSFFARMDEGEVKGLFVMGQNPAAGGPNAKLHRQAMRRLDWLVVIDLFETETASYWYADPEGVDPKGIPTEVFLFPTASIVEKEGSFTNTERMIQWHDKAVDTIGDCRSDTWFSYNLGKRLKELYKDSHLERDAPLQHLAWDYEPDSSAPEGDSAFTPIPGEPDVKKVLQEINGFHLSGKPQQLRGPDELASDGSTACGCWLYCGVYPDTSTNLARSRRNHLAADSVYGDWGWAWPENRRVMYNRASADPEGRPWSERKRLIWWDSSAEEWTGHDVPDFERRKPPGYRPAPGALGLAAIAGDAPFRMNSDGRGWLFAPYGLKDGPLPVHYEPRESPYRNLLTAQQSDPLTSVPPNPANPLAPPGDPNFPLVATSYRLTEHYLSGAMSRFDSWLSELQPEMFAEISPELAADRGVANGDWVVISTPRGEIETKALVTPRMTPVFIDGRPVHTVGMPIHWGFSGEVVGASVNDLTAMVLESNTSIHESKSFVCQLRAGRRDGVKPATPVAAGRVPMTEAPIPATPAAAQPAGRTLHAE
jgi:formate dehydrogenase major subunit